MKKSHARQSRFSPNGKQRRLSPRWPLVLFLLTAATLVTLATGVFPNAAFYVSAAGDGDAISASAAQQIQALVEEKRNRTPEQNKIDSQLLYAIKMHRGQPIATGVQSLSVNVATNDQGRVVVDITGNINQSLLQTLTSYGAKILVSTPNYNSIRVEVALDSLESIAASPDVNFIQAKQEAMTSRSNAAVVSTPAAGRSIRSDFPMRAARVRERLTKALARYSQKDSPIDPGAGTNVGQRQSEGDITHRANIARSRYGIDGTGVKIGVLSNGVVSLAQAQSTGDLPPDVTVLPGQAGTGDEGTAMLEIVHDLAPGSKLYFATAFSSITNFADNIKKLRAAGCDIIVDDVFYFAESVFQDGQAPAIISPTNGGVVTQAVNDVTASGGMYFSSAGNEGNLNDGTAGVFEGNFTNGGTLALIGGAGAGPVHDFDSTAAVAQFDRITLGSANPITLFWSDPLGGSANDYDLYILNSAGTAVVAASTGTQDGNDDPIEIVGGGANVTNNRIVVAKFNGADRFLHVNTFRGRLLFATFGQTHGHSAAAEAYSVAATPSVGPFPMPFTAANVVETFESDGPRKLYFQPDGTPYTPGNFLAAGGITRQKPDITAADGGVVSGVGGFSSPFFGTSAAAPHAGAIAALVKSANLSLTPAQIRTALIASAIDIETPGVDRDSGAGIIMADTAVAAAGATAVDLELGTVTVTEAAGNGNVFVEPGEKGSITVQLRNNSAVTLTNVTATLTTTTPGVTIVPPGSSAYPDIAPGGGTANNTTPFQFIIGSSVPCPTTIHFTLTVSLTGTSSPRVFNFDYGVQRKATISTTLDTVAPANGEGFTSTTGLQTGRLVRTGNTSLCGITKPNPGINGADAAIAHRYDAYRFQNPSTSPICITVTLTTSNADDLKLQSVAYAPTFDPAHISDNYIGDIAGNDGRDSRFYSFTVPALTTFVVVVNEITGGAGGGTAYTLVVDGLPCVTPPPALVSLQFDPSGTSVTEDNTSITLTVTRTGDANFPVSVDYATVDGSASSRSDYEKAIGTLKFAVGQTSATITLLLNEDSFVEGTETFTVSLSNPQGVETFVGGAPTATITINDDVSEPSTNAIDNTDIFVRQHYHDFLNREADTPGLAFWTNNITVCGADSACIQAKRIDTSASFFLSIEFQETGFFAYRFYQASYGRRIGGTVPLTFDEFIRDAAKVGRDVIIGQAGALAQLESNKQAYSLEFVTRPEFLAAYPASLTPNQFVDALNLNTGGSLSTAERNALIVELAGNNTNQGRASVLRQVADDADFKALETNRAFVLMEYFGYLRRNPNDAPDGNFNGFNFWLNKLNGFNGDFRKADMAKAFIVSTEYRSRFGN
ncbi:MAG: S8 family serine peptidase [Blastocatellia bacterium]|nr:S8 family serine peptidase [Blastocatellia bacterium]